MSFPRYGGYKDSGLPWLGEVPEHWEVCALKRLCTTITDGAHISPETENGMFSFVSTKDLVGEQIDFDGCLRTSESSYEYLVRTGCRPRRGDVLFSKDGTVGRTVVVDEDREFVVASSLIIIRPDRRVLDTAFLHRLCQSSLIGNQVESYVKGAGLPRLSIQNLLKVIGVFPPISEQLAIATFLDRETAKIDELVEEQRLLIELLTEKRQAVISHAVTKGLNPTAPLKASGLEWLGQLPEHWEVLRNKAILYEIDDRSQSGEEELLTVSHITGVTRRSEKTVSMTMAETLVGYKKCRRFDLAINTMWGWMGALGVSWCDGIVSPSYNVYGLRNLAALNPRYYDYLCRTPAHVTAIKANSTGVWESRLRIYPDTFLSMRVAVPPIEEQDTIASFLDSETAKLDELVQEAERAIALLQERRTALISAAVTGKIDVRGAAPAAAEAA
jgi:type I restriction enzyme S subunit